MANNKRLTFALATAFGLGLIATSSFAGPLVLGPAPMPVVHVAPVIHTAVPIQTSALSSSFISGTSAPSGSQKPS